MSGVLCPFTSSSLLKKVSHARISATFEWDSNVQVEQLICAGGNVWNQGPRNDSVVYEAPNDTGGLARGIVQTFFEITLKKFQATPAIVLRLKQANPEEGNRRVVEEFGIPRYEWMRARNLHCSKEDRVIDVILSSSIHRGIVLVPDTWALKKRHPESSRPQSFQSCLKDKDPFFFEVVNFQQTSFGNMASLAA